VKVVSGGRIRGAPVAIAVSSALLAACLDAPGGDDDGEPGTEQLLANPDFEEEASGWTFEGGVEIATNDDLGLPPSGEGPNVALLGRENNQTDRLMQELRVPDSVHQLDLSGKRCYATDEGFGDVWDTITIAIEEIDGGAIETVVDDSNLDATSGGCDWLPFRQTTGDHAGQLIRIVIEAVTDEDTPTSFSLDGLALTPTGR
jgi:hypothetical protein